MAQRQRRDRRDATIIIAYSSKSRLRGAAEPLSAGAGVSPLFGFNLLIADVVTQSRNIL